MKLSKRIDEATQAASLKFWESIGAAFPEATSGDFGPEETLAIERAMREAVATWVFWNVQGKILLGAVAELTKRGHGAHYEYPGFIGVGGFAFGWDGEEFNGNTDDPDGRCEPAEVDDNVSSALDAADAIENFLKKGQSNVSST